MRKLGADFKPREVAYVESPVDLPTGCKGTGQIIQETPTRIVISLLMETRGLAVLSDQWDKGWHAYLDGNPVPIFRTDHALRGVVAPPGKATLEFIYSPASFVLGVRVAAAAALIIMGSVVAVFVSRQAAKKSHNESRP